MIESSSFPSGNQGFKLRIDTELCDIAQGGEEFVRCSLIALAKYRAFKPLAEGRG